MSFVAARIDLGPGVAASLPPGVIGRHDHGHLRRAADLADAIVADAEREAEAIRARAEAELAERQASLDAHAGTQLAASLAAIAGEWRSLCDSLEPLLLTLAHAAVERIGLQADAQAQVDAACRVLLAALPDKPVDATLHLAPGSRISQGLDALAIEEDASLAPGQLRLQTRQAVWAVDYPVALASVLGQLCATAAEPPRA